jgi:hypothetical protein
MFVGFYLLSVYVLQKKKKDWALLFATHPLVIMEGLINTHNDLIGLALVFLGIYLLYEKKNLLARAVFLVSFGIKYVTLPYLISSIHSKKLQMILGAGVIGLMIVWTFKMETQSWYFLLLLGLIPFYKDYLNKMFLFFAGLLFSYYPFIRFGGWDKQYEIDIKHWIILTFLGLNLLYLLFIFSRRKFLTK